jgi:hypothetical protein
MLSEISNLLDFNFYPISNKEMTLLMSDQGKGTESANNDARKWPILPFDVSRDFIISKEILV